MVKYSNALPGVPETGEASQRRCGLPGAVLNELLRCWDGIDR